MSTSAGATWFNQPRGLTVLFLTATWETFSYYGMRALLVYYMTKQLLIGQQGASFIYGIYTGTAYLTPIFGGMIADRWLGKRRSVVLGGSIMAAGHLMMTFPPLFYPALATIALGNGLFLPSLPSQIDGLYGPNDPRRGWAYNVYYVGVNIGGFLAPLICGTLGEFYGWHWGFGAAAAGMVAGVLIYTLGDGYLPAETRLAHFQRRAEPRSSSQAPASSTPLRTTLILLFAVGIAVTLFRGAYEQIGNTVAVWADVGIDRRTTVMTIPMTWFQSLNPLLIFLMTPPILAHWRRRASAGRADSAMTRMALGAVIVASAYLLLAVAAFAAGAGRASWLWLAAFFFVLTVGELHILPTGLGLFARLAPSGFGATTMAAWFLATFGGSLLAGVVGIMWTRIGHAQFFTLLAGLAVIAAAMLYALDRPVRALEDARTREAPVPANIPLEASAPAAKTS